MERIIRVNQREFTILGDSTDDYYSVYGTTVDEVQLHQTKLHSYIPSRLSSGKFTKLSDAKKFIKIVMGEI